MTVPKYPRTYHLPFSPEIHSDDKTHRCPWVFEGAEVVIMEKLDGGNCCLHNGRVYARSTGQEADHGSFDPVKTIHKMKTLGDWKRYFYGENLYGIHSIEYDVLPDIFFLFGIKSSFPILSDPDLAAMWREDPRTFKELMGDEPLIENRWYSWDEVKAEAANLGFQTVPEVFRGTFKTLKEIRSFMDAEVRKPSAFGPTREGFVIRLARGFDDDQFSNCVAKYVREGHVQSDEHWKVNWKPARFKIGG